MIKTYKKLTAIVIIAVMFLGAFFIPNVALPAKAQQSSPLTFTVGTSGTFVDTLNPFTSSYATAETIMSYVYPSLVLFSPNLQELVPYLANSWNFNFANGTAIFYLNPQAKWSDGVPITAQDVVYSYRNAMQPWSSINFAVSMISNVTALNNYTVEFHFHGPLSFYYMATGIAIVPYHIWKNYNVTSYFGFSPNTTFVGGGPFLIANYTTNSFVILIKNNNFWDPALTPHIDKLIWENFLSTDTEMAALKSGSLDFAGLTVTQYDSLKNDTNLVFAVTPGSSDHYLAFNMYPNGSGNPTLRDLHVREALAYAINVSDLIKVGFQGFAQPGVSIVPPSNPYCDPYLKPYPFNISLANQILNQSGYEMGPNGIRVSPNGTPLSYTLYLPTGWDPEISLTQLLVQWWSEIGVSVKVEVLDSGTLYTLLTQYKQDLDEWGWISMMNYPSLLWVFTSSSIPASDESGYSNATYDQLYNEFVNATSIQQAKTLAFEMQNLTYKAIPYDNLYYPSSIVAYNKKWIDFNVTALNTWFSFLTARLNTTTNVSSSASGISAALTYSIVAVVIIVVVIAGVFYVWIRRKKK